MRTGRPIASRSIAGSVSTGTATATSTASLCTASGIATSSRATDSAHQRGCLRFWRDLTQVDEIQPALARDEYGDSTIIEDAGVNQTLADKASRALLRFGQRGDHLGLGCQSRRDEHLT